jgi:uncharacterized protein (DUF362 family)
MGWFGDLYDRFFKKSKLNTFEMSETMWGYVARDADSYEKGYEQGKRGGNKLQYGVTLRIDNFKDFQSPPNRRAVMEGWVTCKNLFGERIPIENGEYGLYVIDPDTGQRRITYNFDFTAEDGTRYRFSSYKTIIHEPWANDILEDQTTSFAEISRIDGGEQTVIARGIIHYHVETFPAMLASIRVPGEDTIQNRIKMATKFFGFVTKEIAEYSREINPFYKAEYSNIVCSGICSRKEAGGDMNGGTGGGINDSGTSAGESATGARDAESGTGESEFFFFSGAHDRGFPWGDNVSFADMGLAMQEGDTWRRFALSEYAIENLMLKLSEGTYQYEGVLYEITGGYQTSFNEMHRGALPPHLQKVHAKLMLRYTPSKIDTRRIPFDLDRSKMDSLSKEVKDAIGQSGFFDDLKDRGDDFSGLGYTSEIHRLTEVTGSFQIDGRTYTIKSAGTLGEGEFGKLVGLRKPSLYYNYFCALEPGADAFRVHVRTGVLRSLSPDILTGETERIMGDLIGQFSRMDMSVAGGRQCDIEAEEADRLILPREDILEINNDHFPTGTFQRRIVSLPSTAGVRALALEEDMTVINLDAVQSDATATVASFRDEDRFRALDRVIEATGFMAALAKAQVESGKSNDEFSIVIKPNFSFMYSLSDISTFTDPRLVEHLVDRIYEKGYRNISVVEAQSTYTVFFTNRDVPTLARYIGLKGGKYKIVDLSENTVPFDYGGTLGRHEVHPAWRDADFRISFAKNKTHSYAFYTLTIKNIYGALPRKNKFKHYHCNKDLGIFAPTIDYIEAFPIHFGFIDAYFSADGPFGIFADTEPNFTSTLIGGDNIVAVDWVGASKMGYDPLISEYMRLAVERFGKPAIRLHGDHSPYPNWKNVPEIISKAAFGIMDRDFVFGDFLYSAAATMDPFFHFTPDETGRKIARLLTEPVRRILFERVKGGTRELTVDDIKKLFDPEQKEYMEELVKALIE